jgi:hypothetical protein
VTTFLNLPVDGDDGFPQSFLLALGGSTFRFELHVNIAEEQLLAARPAPRSLLDLVGDGSAPTGTPAGILVMAVTRQDPAGDVPVLRRRVLPGLVYDARDLLVTFSSVTVAAGNLNGAGSFGSALVGGVAVA